MKEKKDQFEQFIADSFEKLAKKEEEKNEQESSIQMPEGVRESIRARLDDEIKKLEEKKAYEHLSEEDRRALELGRKMLRQESDKTQDGEENSDQEEEKEATPRKKWTGRKRLRVCLVLAAVLILVMAIGVTGLGGPERVIQMLTQEVGDREIEQIDSSEDNLVIVEEDEEEAYEIVGEELNIEPVKIISLPQNMKFDEMSFDRGMQLAIFYYSTTNQKIVFSISTSYLDSSIGIDMEDKVISKYTIDSENCKIEVSEYNVEDKASHFMAKFSFQGVEYILVYQGEGKEFEKIIEGLHFVS